MEEPRDYVGVNTTIRRQRRSRPTLALVAADRGHASTLWGEAGQTCATWLRCTCITRHKNQPVDAISILDLLNLLDSINYINYIGLSNLLMNLIGLVDLIDLLVYWSIGHPLY